jgi:putative transcriptional regulator
MSLSKLCLFATLVIVAFAVVTKLDLQTKKSDVTTNSMPAPALDDSLGYLGQPASKPVPSNWVSHAKGDFRSPVFLPVQSKNPKDLAAGKLLVASRDLADPDFAETVVLLVHYDTQGAVGLILNRRTNVPLSRVFDQIKAAKARSDPIYLGGPVETPAVFALVRSTANLEGAQPIFGEVYFISTKTLFEKTISSRPDPDAFHVFLGYAGWDNDQLRKEVELGAWFIFPANIQTVFNSDPDSLWRQMIQKTELKLAGTLPRN